MRPPYDDQDYPEAHHRRSGRRGGSRRDHVVTSTVIGGVILFLVFGAPYLKHHVDLDGGLVNAINGGDGPAGDRRPDRDRDRDPIHDPVPEAAIHPERDSLRDSDRRPMHEAAHDLDRDASRDLNRRPREPVRDAVRNPVHETIHESAHDPDRETVRRPVREPAHEPVREPVRDADHDAVRRWLRTNSDDAHPREIRWWPTRELTKLYQDELAAARDAADEDPSLASQVSEIEDAGPDRVCRLKYRTTNSAGAESSYDDLFIVRQGKVRRITKNSSLASAARRYFPDSDGRP